MEVVVRQATAADAQAAAAVYVSSAEHHHALDRGFYRVPSIDAVVSRYRERLTDPDEDSVLFVAEMGGPVVGSCRVGLVPEPSEASMLLRRQGAEIDIAVLDEFRGHGIGQALMARGEEWAAARGARLLLLNAHAANARALEFYTERLSYRQVGVVLAKEIDGDVGPDDR